MPESLRPDICKKECRCENHVYSDTRLIALTGGPGAGKTAVLALLKKEFCRHVVILPEAASIVFNGGFWRLNSTSAKQAAQQAILHIQQDMEQLVLNEKKWSLGLCDRGTLDGLAYWPGNDQEFWRVAQTNLQDEYKRYQLVIHLRTPSVNLGYNHQNPLRRESAVEAKIIDEKIAAIWSGHPRYHAIESTTDFLTKAGKALRLIMRSIPDCCAQGLGLASDSFSDYENSDCFKPS